MWSFLLERGVWTCFLLILFEEDKSDGAGEEGSVERDIMLALLLASEAEETSLLIKDLRGESLLRCRDDVAEEPAADRRAETLPFSSFLPFGVGISASSPTSQHTTTSTVPFAIFCLSSMFNMTLCRLLRKVYISGTIAEPMRLSFHSSTAKCFSYRFSLGTSKTNSSPQTGSVLFFTDVFCSELLNFNAR